MLMLFGHMERMEENQSMKKVMGSKMRLRGRPPMGLIDGMKSVE